MENVRFMAEEMCFIHTFDFDKLDDIKRDAAAKGQTVKEFLADITRRVADVTQNLTIPEDAETSMANTPGKIVLTLRWVGSATDSL